jgi:hypothetical protein
VVEIGSVLSTLQSIRSLIIYATNESVGQPGRPIVWVNELLRVGSAEQIAKKKQRRVTN